MEQSALLDRARSRPHAIPGLDGIVAFASRDEKLEAAYYAALALVEKSARVSPAGTKMLIEGEDYKGCWLESTGSASAEVLSRFFPSLAESTFLSFALLARNDGLIPYKITEAQAAFRQVQMVTPLARSVWNHYCLNETGSEFLPRMYEAMGANDEWLSRNRGTRGLGCVEAFCAYDTGHDLSPRFWHLPDTCFNEDPASCDPDFPALPFLAPDLTANVYCQRLYLAKLARELGKKIEADAWEAKAAKSLASLMRECYDETDECFYDRDALGRLVRVQSDVLLRTFACEAGDDAMFATTLERYLLNPRKFFAKYPPTSIAMDDPRFDPSSQRNSWAGPTNLLSLLRAPAAFEAHFRFVELAWFIRPALAALASASAFPQCLDPWTGEAGYGTAYTPAALCLLDFVERSMGIMPLSDGRVRFSATGEKACAYSRRVGALRFELESDRREAHIYVGGKKRIDLPAGLLAFTDADGRLDSLVGALPRPLSGNISVDTRPYPFSIEPNQVLSFNGKSFVSRNKGGFVSPV